MARAPRQRSKDIVTDEGQDPGEASARPGKGAKAAPAAKGRPPSWFEEAWHGWLKPVGGLLAIVIAYLAYDHDLIPEQAAGRMLLMVVIGGVIYLGIEPALARFGDKNKRYMLIGAAVLWGLIAIAPIFRVVFPGTVLGEAVIGVSKDQSTASVTLKDGEKGPFEVSVTGRLKGSSEVEVAYGIEITGAGESADRLDGELKRTYFNQRTSRRSAGTVARRTEHTENLHRITKAVGPELKLSGEVGGDQLEDGLHVAFRKAGPSPVIFFLVGLLVVIAGVVFDYRMLAPKVERTHVASAAGFTLAFVTYFAANGTAHNLVKEAVAGLLPGALGAFLGWGVSAIACSFKPRPKKMAGTKNKFVDEEE